MTPAETAIRARRKLTNKLIATHDAARLQPFLDAQVKLITGEGSLITGAEAVIAAFEAQFRDAAFITYLRTTDIVEVDAEGLRAAETGRWTATWRDAPELSGTYLAVWKNARGQWVLEAELFVTLS
jgi:hypothetical protein